MPGALPRQYPCQALTWKRLLCACAEVRPTGHHLHPVGQPSPGTHSALWSHTWKTRTDQRTEGLKLAKDGVAGIFLVPSTCMCPVRC